MAWMDARERLNKVQSDLTYLLGNAVELGTYQGRMRFQKLTYLLQRFGLDYGYGFSWHYAGPFSAQLHFDYYSTHMNAEANQPPSQKERLDVFRKKFQTNIDKLDDLELLASVDFLNREYECKLDESKITEIMALRKPKFTEEQVRQSVALLKNHPLAN